ncbi:MAG TPA: TonB-dependent receptor [Puia sp.]|nr:TonB-dependent receptor [Puia sp.]
MYNPGKLLLRLLLVSISFLSFNTLFAQNTVTVAGRVIDSTNSQPVPNVSVYVKGQQARGTLTNADGAYRLTVPSGSTLVFSSTNYNAQEVLANESMPNVILLSSKSATLNDVVVIGYGSRRRKDLTSAISTVDAKDLEKSTALTPELALQGQVSGVSVTTGGGDPTARPIVRIRGVSTFNNADPLYVIDGIPIEEGGSGATPDAVNDPTRRTPINIYTLVNPNDIESISVLKDAAATAVYGLRAGNGVILITTKQGKRGKVRVDFDGAYGWQKEAKTYSFLNTQQFTKFITDAYNANPELSGSTPVPIGQATLFGAVWDPASPDYLGNSPTYDWQDAIINHDSKIKNYNVRVSGASENTNYSVSLGYANNDGAFAGVNSERYSIGANFKSNIGKYIETGFNVHLVQEKNLIPGFGDLGYYSADPWQPIYDNANPYGYAPLWKLNQPITPSTFDISPIYQSIPDPSVAINNYFGELATTSNPFIHQTALGSGYVQVEPISGLKIRGTLSAQQLLITNRSFTSFDNWEFGETPGNPYGAVKNPQAGVRYNAVGFYNSTTTNMVKSLNVDYTHSFGKHNVDLTLNASQENWIWRTQGGNGFITSDNPDLRDFHPNGTQNAYDEIHGDYALIGYLGRLSYNYNSKYYFDILTRIDGSSRFAPDKRWGTFPAASVAWRISEERFMQGITWLNDLKIRGSYGILGNEQTSGGWKYVSIANVVAPSYNSGNPNMVSPGIAFGSYANAELTWEKVHSGNIGFDAVLLNNVLNLTFDYYRKVTKGIIQSTNLTPSAGYEMPTDLNIADVLNRGIELSLGYHQTFGKVNVSANANFSTVHNSVLSLQNHSAIRSNTFSLEEGKPIGFLYGYKTGGIFQSQKEIDDWNATHKDNISTEQKPGDYYFQDLYGSPTAGSTDHNPVRDSIVNENDQTYIGKTIPGYDYGFTLSANYMGIDISAFFHGVGDVQKYNAVRAAGESMNTNGRNQFGSVLGAWTTDRPSNSMPRAVYGDPNGNNRFSDRFAENAGFFRLQNLQIGYTFPHSLMESTKVFQNVRVYASGVNLFLITKWKGLDPEVATYLNGFSDANPPTRQFLVGINASF